MESRWRSNLHASWTLLRGNLGSWSPSCWVLFFVLVPSLLLAIPLLPSGILERFFILRIYEPALVPMFLANYTHLGIAHLTTNLAFYLFTLFLIFLFEARRSRFLAFSLVFLIGLPLVLSLVSVTFARYVPLPPDAEGFSGINYAFLGYLLYLLLSGMQERVLGLTTVDWDGTRIIEKIFRLINLASFILFTNVIILAAGLTLGGFQIMERSVTNGVAHFAGYLFGLLLPVLVDAASSRDKLPSAIFLLHLMSTTGIYNLLLIRIILS
jgi:hypothetical protein